MSLLLRKIVVLVSYLMHFQALVCTFSMYEEKPSTCKNFSFILILFFSRNAAINSIFYDYISSKQTSLDTNCKKNYFVETFKHSGWHVQSFMSQKFLTNEMFFGCFYLFSIREQLRKFFHLKIRSGAHDCVVDRMEDVQLILQSHINQPGWGSALSMHG